MKRFPWILGAVAAAAIAFFSIAVALLPREALAAKVGQQIAAWTGREVSMRGEPEFRLFPALTVVLKEVEVAGPDGMADAAVLSIERLEGRVRFWPLLIGEVEIGAFTMVRPLIRLVREDGAKNWAFQSGAAALQLAFAGDVPLGQFVLENGTLIYENRGEAITERLDGLNVNLEWQSVRQPLSIAGSGVWRGEQVAVSARAATPFAFLNGAATPVEGRLDSPQASGTFTGEWYNIEEPQVVGTLAMSTPSLRGFAAWMGHPVGPGTTLRATSLAGQASYRARVLSVDNARFSLDGNTATGALTVKLAMAPDVTGTLAFSTMDLTPYFAGMAAAFDAGGDWRGMEIETGWFRDFDADIRLSAGSVQIGPLRFGATAASASLRDERLEIGVAQAAFNGGSVSGDLEISHAAEGDPAVVAQLRASTVDLAQAGPALRLPWALAGQASLAVDLAGRGRALGPLVQGLGGTADFAVQNGAFPLFGIAEIAQAGPAAGPQPVVAVDPVKLDALRAEISFSGGMAHFDQASIATPSFTAEAKGSIGLLDGRLALTGTVVPQTQSAAAPVPFTIEGTLVQPEARPLALN